MGSDWERDQWLAQQHSDYWRVRAELERDETARRVQQETESAQRWARQAEEHRQEAEGRGASWVGNQESPSAFDPSADEEDGWTDEEWDDILNSANEASPHRARPRKRKPSRKPKRRRTAAQQPPAPVPAAQPTRRMRPYERLSPRAKLVLWLGLMLVCMLGIAFDW
jgi:hypothetical protein